MNRARTVRLVAAAVIACAVGGGAAIAQQAPAPAAPVEGTMERQVTLTPQQQQAQADAFLAQMEQERAVMRRQLMESREKKDVVKVLCVNDKLSQENVAISSAEERHQALLAAVKRNDSDLATHEFTILSVLEQRSEQLATEASQCIGNEADFQGESSTQSTTDDDLTKEDPSEYPSFQLAGEPPGCATCLQ